MGFNSETTQSSPLILEGVTKRYGNFSAVSDLSMDLTRGQITGFLGPNGAGKSTTLRMALGILSADEGNIRQFGETPSLTSLRRFGFLPEERGLYKKMSPHAIISYFAQLKGMSGGAANARATELLDVFGLGPFAKSKISKLSKGMAQKVQILSTLAHRPDVLLLDEPFSGLDPVNQADLESLIRTQHSSGATVLFSTHVMEHAERLCDRIVIMACGRKMFDGTLNEAYDLLPRQVHIATDPGVDLAAALAPQGLTVNASTREKIETDPRLWWDVTVPADGSAQNILEAVIADSVAVRGFEPNERRLRDVFVAKVEEAERLHGAARHA